MGTWGTAISSNDTYADVYEEFIDLYNDGLDVSEITKKLIDENQETINTPEGASDFWFAIANGQWECKALDKVILLKVENIINKGEDLRVWVQQDASPASLKAREKVLDKFLLKLKTEKDKPKKRTKKKLYNSLFKKGDCLVYKMDNNYFGGAFVLTDEQATFGGTNYIAITTIEKSNKPTIEDFINGEVYVERVNGISFGNENGQNWIDQPQIGFFHAILFNRNEIEIEVIGQLPVYKNYQMLANTQHIGFGWTKLKSALPSKKEYIDKNGSSELKLTLAEWTRKH